MIHFIGTILSYIGLAIVAFKIGQAHHRGQVVDAIQAKASDLEAGGVRAIMAGAAIGNV